MIRWVCYLPSWRELIVRVIAWSLALVNELYKKKIPQHVAAKTAVICLLSFTPAISTRFFPRCSIVQENADTNVIPVWSQFKIRSGGISFISTVAKTSSRKVFFIWRKFATAYLLCAVVAFLCTNFIRCRSEWAQNLLICTGPPNSASIRESCLSNKPRAAAVTILVDTAPPPSLTFSNTAELSGSIPGQAKPVYHTFWREGLTLLCHLQYTASHFFDIRVLYGPHSAFAHSLLPTSSYIHVLLQPHHADMCIYQPLSGWSECTACMVLVSLTLF